MQPKEDHHGMIFADIIPHSAISKLEWMIEIRCHLIDNLHIVKQVCPSWLAMKLLWKDKIAHKSYGWANSEVIWDYIYSRDDVRGNSDVCIAIDTCIEFITIEVVQVKNAHSLVVVNSE